VQQQLVFATEVDHKVPHRGDQDLFWDTSNWQSLCKPCHSAKTAREDGGFGRQQQ
jgi:5-methylcytosine-specific restriction protein A